MGLFDIFNKKKKTTEAISASRNIIIQTLATMKVTCRDADTVHMLNEIRAAIEAQPESKKEEVVRVDMEILNLLDRAGEDISAAMYSNARAALFDVKSKITERSKYCSLGGTPVSGSQRGEDYLKKLREKYPLGDKSSIESIKDEIRKTNRALEENKKKFEYLKERYEESGDQVIAMEAESLDLDMIEQENNLRTLTNYLTTLNQSVHIERISETGNRWKSEVEEAELNAQIAEDNYDRHMAEQQDREDRNARLNDKLHAGAQGGRQGTNVFDRRSAADNSASVFERRGGSTQQRTGAAAQGTAQQTQYGNFDASNINSREMMQDIKRTISALEKQIENCNDKIEDANDDFTDLNSQLRSLLTRRENASPSQCLVLDGQIDELNSKRSSVMNKIKQYRQIKANLSDRLNILEKLGTAQDTSSMLSTISEITGGRLSDMEGIAMFLKDTVSRNNEALENMGMAVAVTESEDIAMNSVSATYAGLTDATNISVKDDHKYDNLMLDLGMPV